MKLIGRTVLLTGGGTGIGRALARQLAEKGNSVVICGRRLEPLQKTATAAKGICPYRCDLTSSDDIQAILAGIERDGHQVDTLISNAAIFGFDSLAGGLDLEEAKQIIDANLFAPIELTQRMLGRLRAPDAAGYRTRPRADLDRREPDVPVPAPRAAARATVPRRQRLDTIRTGMSRLRNASA